MQRSLRLSISKCFYPNNLFLFWAGGLIYHFHNKSVELKTSSFQFETGPGGEDEECLDDGSGEEPEGGKWKWKVWANLRIRGESESETESESKIKVWPTTNISILSSAQTSSSQSRLAPRRYFFFLKQYSNTNIDSKSLSVCCKYRHANKTDFSGSWKTHC